jgi:hypothetical protein
MAERTAACPVAHTTGGAMLTPRSWTVTAICGVGMDEYSAVQVVEYVVSAHVVVYNQGIGYRRRGSCQVAGLSFALQR